MSEIKRSEKLDKDKVSATLTLNFIKTLRRLSLFPYPYGFYYDPTEVFSVWAFAKKYGVSQSDQENEE